MLPGQGIPKPYDLILPPSRQQPAVGTKCGARNRSVVSRHHGLFVSFRKIPNLDSLGVGGNQSTAVGAECQVNMAWT